MRLGTDYIDVYFSHWPDPETPTDETLSAYDLLKASGNIRAIGASNMTVNQVAEALRVSKEEGLPRYHVVQPEYNLYNRTAYESALQKLCAAEGLACVPYYGLAAGFLTGKYRPDKDFGKSVRRAQMSRYMTDRCMALLAALDHVADRHGATQAEVALAWLMAQPGVTAPIASAPRLAQVESLARAASLHLDAADLRLLDVPDG